MARNRFTSILLSAGVLLTTACASQAPSGALDERYFQQEIRNYKKVERDGQTLYCQNVAQTASLIPHRQCVTEASLRRAVEDWRRTRNPVERPMHATIGSIG
jgi:hypothetical protein